MQLNKQHLKPFFPKKFQKFDKVATVLRLIWIYQPSFIIHVFWHVPFPIRNYNPVKHYLKNNQLVKCYVVFQ